MTFYAKLLTPSRLRHRLCSRRLECALANRRAVSKLTKWSLGDLAIDVFVAAPKETRLHNPTVGNLTPTATTMLNFKNIKSELRSNHGGARAAAAEPELASDVMIGDWDALSIAVIAQITAPLRLRGTTRHGLLGL